MVEWLSGRARRHSLDRHGNTAVDHKVVRCRSREQICDANEYACRILQAVQNFTSMQDNMIQWIGGVAHAACNHKHIYSCDRI